MTNSIVIGLTGRFGAGCTVTSRYFEKIKKLKIYHLSDCLKKLAYEKHKDFKNLSAVSRRNILQDIGDKLRQDNPIALVQPVIEEIKKNKIQKVVIECLRNPNEINALKDHFGKDFFLFAIDAETDKRWERLKANYDNKKQFEENDKRDEGKKQPFYGQKVKDCMELADIYINSNEDFFDEENQKNKEVIDIYAQRLDDFYNFILKPNSYRPPYPDETCMHHAFTEAMCSRCSSRQVGAVIVHEVNSSQNDKNTFYGNHYFVIATGCNNVPPGEQACNEIIIAGASNDCYRKHIKSKYFKEYKYCKMCGDNLKNNLLCKKCGHDNGILPGKLLDICRAVHAEEASILQAAMLGSSSLKGTKLYSTAFPCMLCCKKIIAAGIKHVVYLESYPLEESLAIDMFKKCGVKVSKYQGVNPPSYFRLFKKKLE